MDEKDPIADPILSSITKGSNRTSIYLKNTIMRFIGREMVRFTKAIDGKKNAKGILKEVNEDKMTV